MAVTTIYCGKFSNLPPNPNPPSLSPNPTRVIKRENVNFLKRLPCLVGIISASAMIGIQTANITAVNFSGEAEAATEIEIGTQFVEQSKRGERWSDKRRCPSWQSNSLETIVPENLPRPSAHRRWEAIGFSGDAPAPGVKVDVHIKKCFSM